MALTSGPVIATMGLASLIVVALLPGLALMTISAFAMGIGIGTYNMHPVARVMDSAASDEHRSTAAALSSVRSRGTAFGAVTAGVVANLTGLGDATEPGAVGHAVTAVYMFCCIPFGLAALMMSCFVRVTLGSRSGFRPDLDWNSNRCIKSREVRYMAGTGGLPAREARVYALSSTGFWFL